MKPRLAYGLVLLAVLVTGCPRNQYIIELTPHGDALERQLTFYRESKKNTYHDFPEDQLTAIKKLYPGGVKRDGQRHIARAEFTNAMPNDVGGAGSWTNITTSMGNALLYSERFRGRDDFVTTSKNKLDAADQLTDLLISWSRQELGKEPDYENLRRFLDMDFRRDFKNFALYNWASEISANFNSKAKEEFAVRFGQYLSERGYLKMSQLPGWFVIFTQDNYPGLMPRIQRLIAEKMGLPESEPIPQSLAFLADDAATWASLEKFLATTDAYRASIKQWEEEKKSDPSADKPKPSEAIEGLLTTALDIRMFSTDDHLAVKLSLPSEPIHTNGKWDAARRQVLWESNLDEKEQSPRLPAFCYASWSAANESFQKEHFGKVILDEEELLQYCLWRASLNARQAGEWETLLTGLNTNHSVIGKLDAFRFSDEPAATAATSDGTNSSPSEFPRSLLRFAITNVVKTCCK